MYGPDLSAVHHAGFVRFAEAAADLLVGRLRAAGVVEGTIVDLGCGSGALSARVAAAGYAAHGVDVSPAMLRIAQDTVPQGTFVEASVIDAGVPPCVGVACVGEILNYAYDPRAGDTALEVVLTRVARALPAGGVLLLDLAGPGRIQPNPREGVFEDDQSVVIVRAQEEGRRAERRITTFRRIEGGWRRSDEHHPLVLFEPEAVVALLARIGFDVRRDAGYGAARFPPGWHAFEATKR